MMWRVTGVADRIEEVTDLLKQRLEPAALIFRSARDEASLIVIDPSDKARATLPPGLVGGEVTVEPVEYVQRHLVE